MPSITLSDGTHTVTLPPDLEWIDEYAWLPIDQSEDYSVTGALIVDIGERQSGRVITLAGDDSTAWIMREDVDALRAWAATPGQTLTLTLADEREFEVIFRHSDAPALDASPVAFAAPVADDDFYIVTLKFLEI